MITYFVIFLSLFLTLYFVLDEVISCLEGEEGAMIRLFVLVLILFIQFMCLVLRIGL